MPYVGKDFSPTDVGESEVYSFDFSRDLNNGETIASAVWTCTDTLRKDGAPATRLIGSSATSGNIVSHRLANMVNGANYLLVCKITTSQSNVKSLWSHVKVQSPS